MLGRLVAHIPSYKTFLLALKVSQLLSKMTFIPLEYGKYHASLACEDAFACFVQK